jgi:hypothetical protein
MNLFRSEEHPRRWAQFNPAFVTNLQPLAYWLERFSDARFRARIRSDYISWLQAHPR